MMSNTVVHIYGGVGCSACASAEKLAELKGFDVLKTDIGEVSPQEWIDRIEIIPRSIPQIFVNGEYVGGLDSFRGWLHDHDL